MDQNYTANLLIKSLYDDLAIAERIEFEVAKDGSLELREEEFHWKLSKAQLPKVQFRPKASTVERLLRYSAESELEANC